jgi:tetratricopeptide (TPR) repeat protein
MQRRSVVSLAGIAALCLAPLTALHAQSARLLDASSVSERDDHADLAIDFTCTLRYQSHTPASEGDRLRITLAIGNDCGIVPNAQFPVDRLMPADAAGLVRSIELQPGLTGGAELLISWNRIEKFVLAPAAGMRGLRVRVPRRNTTRIVVGEPDAASARYAVNLESSRTPFVDMAVAAAAAKLAAPAYVSAVTVEGEQWFRLRAGPFETRRTAETILRTALPNYPEAWLGIEDDSATVQADGEPAQVSTTVAATRPPETRADPQLDALLEEARTAMARKRYDDAVSRLTQLTAAEDYQHRIDAAELLGLARERKGQLTQAKAAYEDYLRRYPQSRAANRIRQRLQTLRTAALPGKRGSGGADGMGDNWTAYGSLSQIYRREDSRLSSSALSRNLVTQNALLTDADGVLRHRGERFDITARSSFGYAKDLQPSGRSRPLRVSAAFVDLSDRELALSARLGRQSRGMAGVNGAFDGLLGSWQWHPNIGTSAVVGLPVESTRNGLDSDRTFIGFATDFTTEDRRWNSSVYALAQQYAGRTDRRSVGLETRYLQPGRTLVMMLDYDLYFGDINNALLLGTLVTDSRWTFNLDASRQRSPLLSIRNALIGQPTVAFDDLTTLFTDDELDQLAADRAAQLMQMGFSASHPIGERGQWTVNLLSVNLSGTPSSGGVAAVPNPGRDDSLSTELLINSLFRAGDTHSLALRYQRGDTGRLISAGFGSRLPFGSALRMTTRLRVDRRSLPQDGSSQWAYVPSLRLDYQRGASAFELEAGAELSRRNGGLAERNTRRFFSAGYRLFLDRNRR